MSDNTAIVLGVFILCALLGTLACFRIVSDKEETIKMGQLGYVQELHYGIATWVKK